MGSYAAFWWTDGCLLCVLLLQAGAEPPPPPDKAQHRGVERQAIELLSHALACRTERCTWNKCSKMKVRCSCCDGTGSELPDNLRLHANSRLLYTIFRNALFTRDVTCLFGCVRQELLLHNTKCENPSGCPKCRSLRSVSVIHTRDCRDPHCAFPLCKQLKVSDFVYWLLYMRVVFW